MFKITLLSLLFLVAWAPVNAQDNRIRVPDEVDGAVDTYWEVIISGLLTCDTPDVCELHKRVAEDTYLGSLISGALAKGQDPAEALGMSQAEFDVEFERIRHGNAVWMQDRIARAGWFDIESSGEDADDMAFLILQHSDFDVQFQKNALVLLKELLAEDKTNPQNVAYLTDRVARADGTPQTYGTQGSCTAPKTWEPNEILDVANVDARRANVGLGTLEEYAAGISLRCP